MLQLNFSPFPLLQSGRLIFRRLSHDDSEKVLFLRGNSQVMRYIPRPLLKSIDEAKTYIDFIDDKINKNIDINWAVTTKESDDLIGIMGFYRTSPEHYRTELGYMILSEYHGKGLVTEAVKVLLNFGFNQLGFNSICACVDTRNTPSCRVLEKNGFRKEGHFLQDTFHNNEFSDTFYYGILKVEFNG